VTKTEIFYVNPDEVCNLGRVPMPSANLNPLRQTVAQIKDKKNINFKETYVYKYYKDGIFTPNNLAEFYGIECSTLSEFRSDNIFLPWLHIYPVEKFKNHDFFGRRNNEEIYLLVEKLKQLTLSIEQVGFYPEKFNDRKGGYVTGYWLKNDFSKKFFIISGNHRSAVLGALGLNTGIPIRYEICGFCKPRDKFNNEVFKKNCINFFLQRRNNVYLKKIDAANSYEWPAVKSGFLSRATAMQIFYKYWGKND
jgi:hypothetical protein